MSTPQDLVERNGRMLDRLGSRMHQTIGRRADMYIEDFESIDKDSCRAMVAYTKGLGGISSENLEEFVIREFGGKLVANIATAQNFSDLGRVMVILTRAKVNRPMEDAESMRTVVAGAIYIDKQMQDTWEVTRTEDGQPYLSRISADDISHIVDARRARMSTAGKQPMTIAAAVQMTAGVYQVGPGDIVKVVHRDTVHSGCTVSSVGDENLTVKIPNIGSTTVSRQAVVQVEQISAKRAKESMEGLQEYYSQVYGPEYSRLLTKS